MNHNFVKIAAGIPSIHIGDPIYNAEAINTLIDEACLSGTQLISFPELSLTGYTIGDYMHYQSLLDDSINALKTILQHSVNIDIIAVIGMPVTVRGLLFNCGVALHRGKILAIVPKRYIPNYGEFYERRLFASSRETHELTTSLCGQDDIPFGEDIIINTSEFSFGIEICEDLWAPIPPSTELCLKGAEVIINLSASDELLNKNTYLQHMVCHQTMALMAGYVYCSAGPGESSTDLVFIGKAGIAECGDIITESERFFDKEQIITADLDLDRIRAMRMSNSTFWSCASEFKNSARFITCKNTVHDYDIERHFSQCPYFSQDRSMSEQCNEMFSIQVTGLTRRMRNSHIENLIIGISGGLDSTLALLVAAEACNRLNLPRTNIHAITMPGYGTSARTHNNANIMMEELGVSSHTISIAEACDLHFRQINHDSEQHDATYENTQARYRTFILMNLANKYKGIVVGTGDLSELVLGWATYNGDHMSMYGVNSGLPKTLIRRIIEHLANNAFSERLADCLNDIVDTPISPELIPMDGGQITEDFVGPYPLHDFFIFYTLRYGYSRAKILMMAEQAFAGEYDDETIAHWYDTFWHRFKRQQFKRSCLPDGPKVLSIGVSPRGDLRLPSDLA